MLFCQSAICYYPTGIQLQMKSVLTAGSRPPSWGLWDSFVSQWDHSDCRLQSAGDPQPWWAALPVNHWQSATHSGLYHLRWHLHRWKGWEAKRGRGSCSLVLAWEETWEGKTGNRAPPHPEKGTGESVIAQVCPTSLILFLLEFRHVLWRQHQNSGKRISPKSRPAEVVR